MFGAEAYADTPYASLQASSIIVAACIHTDLQMLYTCSVGCFSVYTSTINKNLVYTVVTGEKLVNSTENAAEVC